MIEYVGGNLDPVLGSTILQDSSDNPTTNTDVLVRIEPVGGTPGTTSYPQVGTGVTDTKGYIDAGVNVSSYLQNSQYDSGDSVTLDVYTQDSSGNLSFVQMVPYSSGSYDPVLELKQALNSSSQPVVGGNVRVLAELHGSEGTATQIGTGVTDGFGYPYVTIDTTPILNNPDFVTPNFVVQLEVDYQAGSSDSWHEAFTTPEYIGGDNDPVLMTKQIYSGGNPVSGAAVDVYAVSLADVAAGTPGTAGDPLLAAGTTAPDGTLHVAPLDLTGVQQNPVYEGADDNIDIRVVYDQCATGTDSSSNCSASPPTPDWQTASDVKEYFGTTYDSVLAQQQVLDSGGTPIVDQSVTIQAVSRDGSTIDAVGTGTTNDTGNVIAPIDATSLQGDTAYQDPNRLALKLAVALADEDGEGGQQDLSNDGFYSRAADGSLQQGVSAAEPLLAGGQTCNTSEDPSEYSGAMASACGMTVYPVVNEVTQPTTGERDYTYYEQGQETGEIEPPVGFNPLAATANELEAYGYPDPPPTSDIADYAAWQGEVTNADLGSTPTFDAQSSLAIQAASGKPKTPPPTKLCIYTDTIKGEQYKNSMCWTGEMVFGNKSPTTNSYPRITNAFMEYTEPKWVSDPNCNAKGYSEGETWVGIGPYRLDFGNGYQSKLALGQDGTRWNYLDNGEDKFFYETLSRRELNLPIFPRSVPPLTAGDQIQARTIIQLLPHNRWVFTANFKGQHGGTLHIKSFYLAIPSTSNMQIDPSQADYILERPPPQSLKVPNYQYSPLGDFGSWSPSQISTNGIVKAGSALFSTDFNQSWRNTQNYWNIDSKYFLSTVSPTSSGFNVRFDHCL